MPEHLSEQFTETARLFLLSVWGSAPLVQPMPGTIYKDDGVSIELTVPPKAYRFDSPKLLVCYNDWTYPILADRQIRLLPTTPKATIKAAIKSMLQAKRQWSDKFRRHLRWQYRYVGMLLETIDRLVLSLKREQVIANLLCPDGLQTPDPPERLAYGDIIYYAANWLVTSLNLLAITSGYPTTLYLGGIYLCANTEWDISGNSVFAAVDKNQLDSSYSPRLFRFSTSSSGKLVYIGQICSRLYISALFLRRASIMIEALSAIAEKRFTDHPVSGEPYLIRMELKDVERTLINNTSTHKEVLP